MMTPNFLEGVFVALLFSVAGAIGLWGVVALAPVRIGCELLIALLALGYLAYLLSRSSRRGGRILTVSVWLIIAIALLTLPISFTTYLFTHAFTLWLFRALYFHSSLLTAFADLLLIALGLGAAFWTAVWTGSSLLSIWCFFLIQAVFVSLPGLGNRSKYGSATRAANDEDFINATRSAEAALHKISSIFPNNSYGD